MTNMINNEGLKGLYLKLKVIYYRPQANLISNIEKLKMLPLKLDKDDNTKEKESELERKKERYLSMFTKNILYRENHKDAIKNLFEIIYESIKLQDKNIICRNVCSKVFIYTNGELPERESNKNSN